MRPADPPPLPPGELDLLALLPLIVEANVAVATLDGLYHALPNPDVLLSPISTQEAVRSSMIEGTQAELQDVWAFEAGTARKDATLEADIQEVLNYRNALLHAGERLGARPFSLNLLLEIHDLLMDSVRGHNRGRGRFRTVQNWIGGAGSSMAEATFVPPPPETVLTHLGRWETYWHTQTADPLTQLALIHAQFEIIHPFVDGNGRLGRMIIPLFLVEKERLRRPSFYLSAYFESHRDAYIGHLREIPTPGGWTRWCRFFLEGVIAQAQADAAKVEALQSLYGRLKDRILELTHSQYAVPLLDYMFEHPIFQSSTVSQLETMPTVPMVWNMLKKLQQDGILHTIRAGAGRRSYVFALAEFVNLTEGKEVFPVGRAV